MRMKKRFRLIRRGVRGGKFYCVDTQSGKRTSLQTENPDDLIAKIEDLYYQVSKELNEPISGIGLGWPGAVDRQKGLVLQTPNIKGFVDYPLKDILSKKLNAPVQIENDAKCAGLAEKHFGQAQKFHDFYY